MVLAAGSGGVSGREDGVQQGGNVVGLDDTPVAPNLHDGGVVDGPFVLFVCCVDDVEALDVSGETGGVDCPSQVFDECLFILNLELGGEERSVEGLFDVLPVAAIGGRDAQEMGCGQSGSGNVEGGGLHIRPYSCSFRAVDVLDYLVLYVCEDVFSPLVFLLADVCSYLD